MMHFSCTRNDPPLRVVRKMHHKVAAALIVRPEDTAA
jgi:hypothetical protein